MLRAVRLTSGRQNFRDLPNVNGNIGYGYSWGRGLDPVTNNFVSQEIRSSNISGNASLPVYNGMTIHNTIKQNQRHWPLLNMILQKQKMTLF